MTYLFYFFFFTMSATLNDFQLGSICNYLSLLLLVLCVFVLFLIGLALVQKFCQSFQEEKFGFVDSLYSVFYCVTFCSYSYYFLFLPCLHFNTLFFLKLLKLDEQMYAELLMFSLFFFFFSLFLSAPLKTMVFNLGQLRPTRALGTLGDICRHFVGKVLLAFSG